MVSILGSQSRLEGIHKIFSTADTTLQTLESDQAVLFLYLMPLEMAFSFEYYSHQ
jgi:hypothetical protein